MTNFKRGDVVVVDLGMTAKVRPAVVVSIPAPDSQRSIAVVAPMTTEIRNGECEVRFPKPPWLKQACVVNLLGITGVDNSRIERVLGTFPQKPMQDIDHGLKRMLGLK
jgi:mRNA interferase MazF